MTYVRIRQRVGQHTHKPRLNAAQDKTRQGLETTKTGGCSGGKCLWNRDLGRIARDAAVLQFGIASRPAGGVAVPPPARPSTGSYTRAWAVVGRWFWVWLADGTPDNYFGAYHHLCDQIVFKDPKAGMEAFVEMMWKRED